MFSVTFMSGKNVQTFKWKKEISPKNYCRPDNLSVNCRLGNKTYTGTISQCFIYSAIWSVGV